MILSFLGDGRAKVGNLGRAVESRLRLVAMPKWNPHDRPSCRVRRLTARLAYPARL